ncbi:MAG: DUF2207 domain-containing protein [Propionicimonas sp.]
MHTTDRSHATAWWGIPAALLLSLLSLLIAAPAAQAAAADVFDAFDVQATLNTDGTVNVVETITLRFGSSSGRHGLERTLITREPDPDTGQDLVYTVDYISAESLTPGASASLGITHEGSGRETYVQIRVGDADRTVASQTATYRLSYRIAGLMRHSDAYDELYWDLTGSSMPAISKMTATITVPGGAQGVFCSIAEPGVAGECDKATTDGDQRAVFAGAVPSGELMTVSVKVASGLVSPNTPIFEENAETAQQRLGNILMGSSSVAGALVALGGWWMVRRRTGDRRFLDLPPGVLPAKGQEGREGRDPKNLEIPVAFSPPRVSLAEAGLLLDGGGDVRHTTATLVGLAVNGAIRLRSEDPPEATLLDPDRATDGPSKKLLSHLFGSAHVVALDEPGTMTDAHNAVQSQAEKSAKRDHWFLPAATGSRGTALLTVGLVAFGFFAVTGLGGSVFYLWPLGLAIVLTGLYAASKFAQVRRSGRGRALTDQVVGFRTYLATAEADQLQFEEGEDIFSKYLPWAILFDLTDRWTRVCEQLVAMGRLSSAAPDWYYGTSWNLHAMSWQLDSMQHSVATAAGPPPPSFSDSGFGSGGSAFGGGGSFGGGGGFSGGGGGGGGGGSW